MGADKRRVSFEAHPAQLLVGLFGSFGVAEGHVVKADHLLAHGAWHAHDLAVINIAHGAVCRV